MSNWLGYQSFAFQPAGGVSDHQCPARRRAARQHPWAQRSSLLFFRGASTGGRNWTDPQLSEAHPDLLDVKVSNVDCSVHNMAQGTVCRVAAHELPLLPAMLPSSFGEEQMFIVHWSNQCALTCSWSTGHSPRRPPSLCPCPTTAPTVSCCTCRATATQVRVGWASMAPGQAITH